MMCIHSYAPWLLAVAQWQSARLSYWVDAGSIPASESTSHARSGVLRPDLGRISG